MKIVLINPQTETISMREGYGYHENLALGLTGALLRKNGYDVSIWDLRVHKLNENQVVGLIIKRNVKLVGLSVNYVTLPSALKIVQILKFSYPDCLVVFGGEHASYLDEKILNEYRSVDYIIRGEGEYTLLELSERLKNNQSTNDVEGISYFDNTNKKIIRTPNRKSIAELDNLPFASREVASYAIKSHTPIEIGILAQRGCPFRCSFCNANRFLLNEEPSVQVRTRSPISIVNEIETLLPFFESQNLILRFYDATFVTRSTTNRQWIDEFCSLLEERKIKIPFDAFIRSDSFNFNEDKNLITRLNNIGMISTYIGLEAGDNNTLEIYNKGIKCSVSYNTILKLREFGIDGATNGVITFHQNVTLGQINNSIKFLKTLGFCTLWNISSRAETLPGILLEKEMTLLPRRTVWDVENYHFTDSKVALLYDIMNFLKTNYYVSQFEDYVVRKLRESLKLKSFYKGANSEIETIKYHVEKDISKIQTITHDFFLSIIDNIEKGNITEVSKLYPEIKIYVQKTNIVLFELYKKYSYLIQLYDINYFNIEGVI